MEFGGVGLIMSVILEFQKINNYMRVAAIDERTGVEAISLFPTNISRSQMEDQAIKKLKYVLEKRKKEADENGGYY